MDITVSALLLLMLWPILIVIAVAIQVESPGPTLYRSLRIGRGGRRFNMLKFRKMHEDPAGLPITTAGDPRYTRIGRWLTRSKLDEVPQFWNVLRGDMTLVGPRPEDPLFVDERPLDYDAILLAPQGVTGLSQLAFYAEADILDPADPLAHYRNAIWPGKIALDQLYVAEATIWWDLRILFWSALRTVTRRPVAVDRESGAITLRRR